MRRSKYMIGLIAFLIAFSASSTDLGEAVNDTSKVQKIHMTFNYTSGHHQDITKSAALTTETNYAAHSRTFELEKHEHHDSLTLIRNSFDLIQATSGKDTKTLKKLKRQWMKNGQINWQGALSKTLMPHDALTLNSWNGGSIQISNNITRSSPYTGLSATFMPSRGTKVAFTDHENNTLIIVGDLNQEALVEMLEDAFDLASQTTKTSNITNYDFTALLQDFGKISQIIAHNPKLGKTVTYNGAKLTIKQDGDNLALAFFMQSREALSKCLKACQFISLGEASKLEGDGHTPFYDNQTWEMSKG